MTPKVRCPYCIAAGYGIEMVRNTANEYVCPTCGHVKYSDGSHCNCARCQRKNDGQERNKLQTSSR